MCVCVPQKNFTDGDFFGQNDIDTFEAGGCEFLLDAMLKNPCLGNIEAGDPCGWMSAVCVCVIKC